MLPFQINLILAWLWIVAGFCFGAIAGLQFHREDWMGGYGSFKRRLYRLGHISFFGLAIMNLLFFFTMKSLDASGWLPSIASWGFALGALTMPACCLLMAHYPKAQSLFFVPVSSLIIAGICTLIKVAIQ